ncbi:MAG: glycosyltransferase [Cyclobacteriaceae bacterium]|nr:glycosyltransferase [Cyclobacteriaceae bacterium]
MRLKHFVISRFNIDIRQYLSEYTSEQHILWMRERLSLYFKYTYPTLLSQQNPEFQVILLLDEFTSIDLLSKIKLFDKNKIINFVFTSNKLLLLDLNRFLKKKVGFDEYLITTALDSDDGLMPWSIGRIQKEFVNANRAPLGLNLSKGYIVNTNTGVFHIKSFLSNPFYSLCEKGGNFKTCYSKDHLYMSLEFETLEIDDFYYWIQNIHKGNLLNQVKGFPVLFFKTMPSEIRSIYGDVTISSYFLAFGLYFKSKLINLIVKVRRLISFF